MMMRIYIFLLLLFLLFSCRTQRKVVTRWDNGNPKSVKIYLDREKNNFKYLNFYEDKKIESIYYSYKNSPGFYQKFYKNGQKSEECFSLMSDTIISFDEEIDANTVKVLSHSNCTKWFETGTISEQTEYIPDRRITVRRRFDMGGSLIKLDTIITGKIVKQ